MSSTRRIQRSISRTTTRSAAVLGVAGGLAGLTLTSPIGAAAATAAAGDPQVFNQETVQVELDPSGDLDVARLYSQLTVLGKGSVDVQDPTSREGLRDLNGFSAPLVRDGKAQYSITVDGREDRRTVADYTGELPVTLKATYTLDGEPIDAEDLVGRSGTVEATYTVVNKTATPTEITYKDGTGKDVTETVDLVTPYVGRLGLTLPAQFKNVQAPGSDDAGDGKGGTGFSWTLVLFNPLGEPAQRLSWTAEVEDAELPPTTLQVVPVDVDGNRVIGTGQTTFGQAATGLSAATAGAYKIDSKVLEVRDGARKIFDGLVQLQAGADALNAGLSDTAAPGARQLADGLGQAKAGGEKLAGGLGQLDAGADQLSAGLSTLNGKAAALGPGSAALAQGSKDLTEGLGKIKAGIDAMPTTMQENAGFAALKKALTDVQAGIGTPTTAPVIGADGKPVETLLNGIAQLKLGLSNPGWDTNGNRVADSTERPGVRDVAGLLSGSLSRGTAPAQDVALSQVTSTKTSLAGVGALQNVQFLKTMLGCDADSPLQAFGPAFERQQHCSEITRTTPVAGGANVVNGTVSMEPELVDGILDGLAAGLGSATTDGTALNALARIQQGIGGFVPHTAAPDPTAQTLMNGLQKVQFGLSNPAWDANGNGVKDDGERPGVKEAQGLVSGGIDQLVAGISAQLSAVVGSALEGSQKIAAGQASVAGSAPALIDGIGQLDAGGKKLADGTGTAAAGSGALVEGLVKLSDGGTKLADGLGTAADGSGKIADGVTKVKDGVGALADGTNRLSGEGSSLLAGSINTSATDSAKKTAMLAAMAEKGKDGALPYGAPEGATGDAAFSYTLAGANSDVQDSTTRGAAALALLTLGALSGFVARRRTGA